MLFKILENSQNSKAEYVQDECMSGLRLRISLFFLTILSKWNFIQKAGFPIFAHPVFLHVRAAYHKR